jgi:AcrR family transcriptional regulator
MVPDFGGAVAGRPRTLSNDDILDGTARVLHRIGPGRLTLADVAAEVGLAPATLVQRFGSKRGLLLAHAERAAAQIGPSLRAGRTAVSSPLDTLIEVLAGIARDVETPEQMANNLSMLLIDLTDADFYVHARAFTQTMLVEIQALLAAAVEAGELIPCDTARLARAVQTTFNGALILWAIDRDGGLVERIRNELTFLLAPHWQHPS